MFYTCTQRHSKHIEPRLQYNNVHVRDAFSFGFIGRMKMQDEILNILNQSRNGIKIYEIFKEIERNKCSNMIETLIDKGFISNN